MSVSSRVVPSSSECIHVDHGELRCSTCSVTLRSTPATSFVYPQSSSVRLDSAEVGFCWLIPGYSSRICFYRGQHGWDAYDHSQDQVSSTSGCATGLHKGRTKTCSRTRRTSTATGQDQTSPAKPSTGTMQRSNQSINSAQASVAQCILQQHSLLLPVLPSRATPRHQLQQHS